MMDEYKGLINKTIINSYKEALVIDVIEDNDIDTNSEVNDIDNTETKNIKVIEPNTEELEKLDDEIL